MKYKCPTCNKKFTVKNKDGKGKLPSYFPFCSERCKFVDLDQWFEEDYKVITEIQSEENKE
jgi:hypothetical protein